MRDLVGLCDCGKALEFEERRLGSESRSSDATCGRLHDVALEASGWAAVAQLTPERSVPLAGFSRELRAAADAERSGLRFPFAATSRCRCTSSSRARRGRPRSRRRT